MDGKDRSFFYEEGMHIYELTCSWSCQSLAGTLILEGNEYENIVSQEREKSFVDIVNQYLLYKEMPKKYEKFKPSSWFLDVHHPFKRYLFPIGKWKALIAVNSDGWFEGIITEDEIIEGKSLAYKLYNAIYNNPKYIYGVYEHSKFIELLKIADPIVSDPFVFRGTNLSEPGRDKFNKIEGYLDGSSDWQLNPEDNSLCGHYSSIGCNNKPNETDGLCSIECIELDKENQLDELEIKKFFEKLDSIKNNDLYIEIYDKTREVHLDLRKKMLDMYNNKELEYLYSHGMFDTDQIKPAIYDFYEYGYSIERKTADKAWESQQPYYCDARKPFVKTKKKD